MHMSRPTREPLAIPCRVCLDHGAEPYRSIDGRDYRRCSVCAAVFVDSSFLPAADEERARYLLHENDPDDPAYREFLSRLADPLLARLASAQEGLDYGCGPGPALSRILADAGHTVHLYDPFFRPDPSALERTYDFITCTEVAEHFHHPAREFSRLAGMLRPGGWLAVMTSLLSDDVAFEDWYYRCDPTHVVFYRWETFHRIAAMCGLNCETPGGNVVLMRRKFGERP